MFNFFIDLYLSIVNGSWSSNTLSSVFASAKTTFDSLPLWNMFNNSVNVSSSVDLSGLHSLIAIVVSSVCCVGCFALIIFAIRKLFSAFLGR